jgi:hypothetical protein
MHVIDPLRETPARTPLGEYLARTALIVAVLGVLPFALGADPAWQLLGTLVSLAMIVRSGQLAWRSIFSTDPQYLAGR